MFLAVLLDNDDAAHQARDKAQEAGLLKIKSLTQTICNGMAQSEFEDCIVAECYASELKSQHGIDIDCTQFRGNKKWSDRMRDVCLSQGKQWSDALKKQVKTTVAECVTKNPDNALCEHKRSSIDTLARNLEELISSDL